MMVQDVIEDSKTLYLVDGSGFIFRAYYGIRAPMTATDGTPTNAVYGFTRLLVNLIKTRQPANIAVVFDPPGPTFRNEIFAEYKANRPPPPEDLRPQFNLCREAVTAFGLAVLEMTGYEADDLIGTAAKLWTEGDPGRRCVLVTADKDMMQLVTDRVTMWDGKEKNTDIEGVIAKFGVPPEAVADVLGLAGDSSDNIPGVPGIGPKTAATLLGTYTNLENLLANAGEIKGKRGENLRAFAEQARLSRVLATIKLDVPVELDSAALSYREPNPDTLWTFFQRLNFKRLVKEFGLEDRNVPKVEVDRDAYRTILDSAELESLCETIRLAGQLSFDLETTSLSTLDAEVVGIAVAWAPGQAAYIPVGHTYENAPQQLELKEAMAHLAPLLSDPALPKIAQNVKYEIKVLKRCLDLDIQGVYCDTMIAAYLLQPDRRQVGLDALALEMLGHKMISFQEVTESRKGQDAQFSKVALEAATAYAAEDADITLRLAEILMPALEKAGLTDLMRTVELPLTQVIAAMEQTGIAIDADLLKAQSAGFAEELTRLTDTIHGLAEGPFNIDSPKQLAEVLFERLGLPTEKKTKTGFSTDQKVLANLATLHPLPKEVLRYRQLKKLKNTYLDVLPGMMHPRTRRIHTSFHQAVAATGRLSSSDPNLQNIPIRTEEGREIRRAFVAKPGWKLLSADYSQIELRLLAHYSKDPGLVNSFIEKADIHRRTAAEVFGVAESDVTDEQRRQAKAVNFGLMYGMSAFRLSNELKIPQRLARDIIKRYFQQYAGVKTYFDDAVENARTRKAATTILGRTRSLAHIDSKSFTVRQQSERLAINTPIQGSAADLLKLAMLRLHDGINEGNLKSRMLLTVHDELVLEVPEDELTVTTELVRSSMEQVMELSVPLVVEMGIGNNWAEIH